MSTATAWLVLASAAVLSLPSCTAADRGSRETRTPARHTVTIEGMRFVPEHLRVSGGDTVVWVNTDVVPHTATSPAGAFDSNGLDQGQSWRFTTSTQGTFEYICRFHPTMKGTIEVR